MENFQVKILELMQSGVLKKGDLANLDIRHDDWCSRLKGIGPCNCDPEIQVYPSDSPEDWMNTFYALRNSRRRH